MSRVFVVQRPVYRNTDASVGFDDVPAWISKYDLSPAERFGRLVDVLPVGNSPRDVGTMVRLMETSLADFTDSDHLLAIGDPIAIAIASMIAARNTGGKLSVLKYDRRMGEYGSHDVVVS